ncbi:MAG: DNA translocase FtsK [Chloroflexi bacterium]|nr:DNA translocase FtsK [Chloroflexota bacterium]
MKKHTDHSLKLAEYLQRFIKDILGIVLISGAVISFLGYFSLSQGRALNSLVDTIKQGFGWGTVFFLAFLFYIGVLVLFRRVESFPSINLKRLLYLELCFFTTLGFLSILGGNSLVRAAEGSDGGVIGWGIAKMCSSILPLPICSIFFVLIAIISFLMATGFLRKIIARLEKQSISRGYPYSITEEQPDHITVPISPHTSETDLKDRSSIDTPPVADLPPLSILFDQKASTTDESYIKQNAERIEKTFNEFGIPASVVGYRIGPTVIQYALEPGYIDKTNEEGELSKKKIRVSQISSLQRDLALTLGAERLRIEAPIPGYSFVGIEVPNRYSSKVRLKSILGSTSIQKLQSSLKLALGMDVSGNPISADLTRMPHLLIAGTTGSGKSVCISALIASLVMCNAPADLKIAILDPKLVELAVFNGLPHLIGEVETDVNRMLAVLAWAVAEMDHRYRMFEELNARDIQIYNEKVGRRGLPKIPKIAIFIDELASLMTAAPEQTEGRLVRLAQMARATGIHLVVATQRPSTDIVTGLIKANFPARIAFMVASSVDSRVILDVNGAETLLGKGDMLFLDPENGAPKRIQGVMVDDLEIKTILEYWNSIIPPDQYTTDDPPWEKFVTNRGDDKDELIGRAISLLRDEGRASASLLQRKLRIGYPRAAHLMDELEEMGIIGPPEGGGKEREVMPDDEDSVVDY